MKEKEGLQDSTELTVKFEFNPKDGIDNPALSLAEDSEPEEAWRLRFCCLKKEEGESFGFWLRQETGNGGHIVRKVTPGGLAHRRGLREGDRILEVNGASVEGVEHFRVVRKIQSSGQQVLLMVLDGNAYDLATALGRNLAQLVPHHNRPRLCCVAKNQHGFGFSISAPEESSFQGGSLRLLLCAVLFPKSQLKQSSSPLGVLVIDPESDAFYRQRGVRVTASMADASWVPFGVRKLPMVRGPDGYGFLLKEEKCRSGKRGQFLREVDAGMPAEQVGMREGDQLLAVNGEDTQDLDHQEVVLRIRADSNRVTLLVIDAEGSKFYDSANESPAFVACRCHREAGPHGKPTQPAWSDSDDSWNVMKEGQEDGLSQAF
ncbi:hypothetical protein lerEdw1_007588 [Lerista edwardsae]|nr:hypothetical protein lerEdw1_007588 [Lerista edwardsae]